MTKRRKQHPSVRKPTVNKSAAHVRIFLLIIAILSVLTVVSCTGNPKSRGETSGTEVTANPIPDTQSNLMSVSAQKMAPAVTAFPRRESPTMTAATSTKTSSKIQTPEKKETAQNCSDKFGRMEHVTLTASYLPIPMDVRIYLPPCYQKMPDVHYPVLYLIHGQNFTDDQWDRLGADETADRLIKNDQVKPFIIVMPHDAVLRDPQNSPFRRAFIELLMPWVESKFRTVNDREHRAIGGLSRGGAWALYLGLSHYDLFSAIGMHSSFFFNGEEYPTRNSLQTIPPDEMPRLFLDIGSEDHLLQANRQLEKLLIKNNVSFESYLFPGRHEETYWTEHMEQYLRWYTHEW